MSKNLLERIDELDDQEVIRIFEFYSARIFEGMETSPEEMLAGIPMEFKDRAPFESVLKMTGKERAKPLPEADSILLAGELMRGFAQDPAFAPSLLRAMDEFHDDTLMVGTILATGVAVSMIVLASTTAFKGRIGNFEISKTTADANFIESLLKHFPKFG